MAKIFPIKGIMYNIAQDDNLGKYLCPPFDVVDIEDIELLYESSKYNVIRLENGKSFNSDDEKENKYTRASQFFNEWISSNILKKEDNESLFILQEIFKNGEDELIRCSLICNVKVENYENKIIFPHEKTRKKQKEDRFKLMNETKAVFSPIMSMIEDKDHKLNELIKEEIKSVPFRSGEIPFMHKFNLWKINDQFRHISHIIPFINDLITKQTNSPEESEIYSHCLLLPESQANLINETANLNSVENIVKVVLNKYFSHLTKNNQITKKQIKNFINFLINYNNHTKSLNKQFSQPLSFSSRIIHENELATDQYYLLIPNNYQEAVRYSCFAKDSPVTYKLSALTIMNVLTDEQLSAILDHHNAYKLYTGYDFTQLSSEDIMSNDVIIPELNNQTIKDFMETLCDDPESTILYNYQESGQNISLWNLWKQILRENFYGVNNNLKLGYSNLSTLDIFLNPNKEIMLSKNIQEQMEPLLKLIF